MVSLPMDSKTDEEIDAISPGVKGQKVKMKLPIKCEKDWILRRKKLEEERKNV